MSWLLLSWTDKHDLPIMLMLSSKHWDYFTIFVIVGHFSESCCFRPSSQLWSVVIGKTTATTDIGTEGESGKYWQDNILKNKSHYFSFKLK